MQARLIIVMGALLTALNFAPANYGSADVEVPAEVVAQIKAKQRAHARHQEYLAQREAECWRMIVEAIAEETRITDMALAERVAHAIEDASAEFDMDPFLIASLIRVESAGNPNAVSKVGALGLTQIMPATGAEIARELEIAEYDLFHPETNIRMGTYYLRKLLDRFEKVEIALAAYNWGPAHIAKRIRNRSRLPVQYAAKILGRTPEQPPWVEIQVASVD